MINQRGKTFLDHPLVMDKLPEENDFQFEERQNRECAYWGLKPRQIIPSNNRLDAFSLVSRGRGVIYDSYYSIFYSNEGLHKLEIRKEPLFAVTLPNQKNIAVMRFIKELQKYWENNL